jgi:hypothetical protein
VCGYLGAGTRIWTPTGEVVSSNLSLFAGAGTGQMFDFFPSVSNSNYVYGPRSYLRLLESRVKSKAKLRFRTVLDDIKRSKLLVEFALGPRIMRSHVCAIKNGRDIWHLSLQLAFPCFSCSA